MRNDDIVYIGYVWSITMNKLIALLSVFGGILIFTGMGSAYAEDDEKYTPVDLDLTEYEILFDINTRWGNDRIDSIKVVVDGVLIDESCYFSSRISTVCDAVLIFQNETLIDQNERIINLLQTIADNQAQPLPVFAEPNDYGWESDRQ